MKIENIVELLLNRINHLEKLKEISTSTGDIPQLSSIETELETVIDTLQKLKSIGQ